MDSQLKGDILMKVTLALLIFAFSNLTFASNSISVVSFNVGNQFDTINDPENPSKKTGSEKLGQVLQSSILDLMGCFYGNTNKNRICGSAL
jgi:hypothetical protein